MRALGTILGVWAHPDDETYLSAGVMAHAVANGERVVCVTATRGESGSQDEKRWPTATLGSVREAELMTALGILGVTEHEWLDYSDGGLDQIPQEEALIKLGAIFDEVQADTVLTFGPEGMTGHPDHKAISAWTTEAFKRSAKLGAALYYSTVTPEWMETVFPQLDRLDVFFAGKPLVTPVEELGIDMALDRDLLELKYRAISAQVSQSEGLLKTLGRDFFDLSEGAERFVLAAVS
ncbi:MAG: N-acetyl-D-myo-inositol-2-amino-2-deoxy-alpha-D-glucopyranoside deacetylase [Actinomycetota bacterium]|nr:N-acetyl-D-myo-inositol-2-amino-2-deoxy-alpha-D-glucopyranoside deacetylase [Actinomycetota bacterium]